MIRPLFKTYQKELLAFSNTEYGRWFLADKFGYKIEKNEQIVKVVPDGFHILKDFVKGEPVYQAVFYPRSPYIRKFSNILTGLDILYKNRKRDYIPKFEKWNEHGFPNLLLASITVNPDAHPETNSVDGTVYRQVGTEETWATIIAGAGTHADDTTGASGLKPEARTDNATDKFTELYRACAFFYTASLTASATIQSAVESFYANTSTRDNAVWFEVGVRLVTTSHSATTSLATGDFAVANWGSTAIATDKAITTDWTTSAYNDYTLTDTSSISKTGLTRHGLRLDKDCSGDLPTRSVTFGSSVHARSQSSDTGSNLPKLVITYTLGSSGGMNGFFEV